MIEHEQDAVLQEQLARLDALQQRAQELYATQEVELTGIAGATEAPLPEDAWPEAIPEPPSPEHSLDAYIRWIDVARTVLGARAARDRDDVQRLGTQWLLASRNLSRFTPEEVAVLVEAQAKVRERVAADQVAARLLAVVGQQLAEWELAHPGAEVAEAVPAADLEVVRRLLDEATADRVRATRGLMQSVLDVLCAVTLELEIVQREVEQDPANSAEAFTGVQARLAGLVADLRNLPYSEAVVPEDGEALHITLGRCVDRHAGLSVDLAWSGAEPQEGEVRTAVTWITQEYLSSASDAGATSAGLALSGALGEAVLRLTADACTAELRDGIEPGWLLRCRARAAVAGGELIAESAHEWCAIEVRFPSGEAVADEEAEAAEEV
jgi:hypothetical protein